MGPRILACALLIAPLFTSSAVADDQTPSREQAALSEEQALLRRQLLQLTTSMESIAVRFESEGRVHAARLLREGLQHVAQRSEGTRLRTLEEVMQAAQDDLSRGQAVRALEDQQAVLAELERLLGILLDRPDVDDIEQRLQELGELRRQLGDMAELERGLRQEAQALREAARTPEQRALEAQMRAAAAAQRQLLQETETAGRQSGALELEALERALSELARDQATDVAVLESWEPAAREALESAAAPLESARRSLTEAARLERAAAELERGAAELRRANAAPEAQAATRALEEAAEREELARRATGDPTSARTAEALSESAAEARAAGMDEAARAEAAAAMERRAEALEAAAEERRAAAAQGRAEAAERLEELSADAESPAGEVAREVRRSLEQAAEPRAEQATSAALEALRNAAEEQTFVGQAVAASQKANAERAERLGEALENLPAQQDDAGRAAREALERAADAMRAAAQEAEREADEASAQRAGEAAEALAEAQEALAGARAQSSQQSGAQELAQRQEQLAAEVGAMQQAAAQGSMSPEAQEAVEQALETAREQMEQAAAELAQGQNQSAASSQRQALDALGEAASEAEQGVEPTTPEDRAKADELAERQAEIEKQLYDFAQRYAERDQARPLPSMSRAQEAAEQARQEFEQGDLSAAEEQAERAEQAIEEAAAELAEEEEQYQRLRDEELLFRIAEEVTQMLTTHQALMAETLEADAGNQGGRASRAVRLRVRRIAGEEGVLAQRASEIHTAIAAEDSLVFAEIVRNVESDLRRIERDMGELGGYQSGSRVQALQQDVEDSLLWLLEALEEEKQRRQEEEQEQQSGQQEQQEQEGENRLVPDVAELKLLRRLEREVLDSLDELLLLNPELAEAGVRPDALLLEDILRLAHRHERTSDLFQQFRQRLGLPDPDDESGSGEGAAPPIRVNEEPR